MNGEILNVKSMMLAFGLIMPFCNADAGAPQSAGEAGKIKIALAGDSTVASYKETHIAGWGQVIGKYFKANVSIENFAVSGRSTKTFVQDGYWQKLLESKPDYILLQFGHNDSHAKDKPESTDAATEYKDNLRKFVEEAEKAGARIIFVTPMHRRTFGNDGKMTDTLLPYANVMKDVAREKNILCIDLHASSGKLMQDLGDEKSAFLSCKSDDRTHFSPDGADKMAELVVKDLKKTDSPLTSYLK
ncbi:MAG: rhamnogalacturonan acetylesterase [Victivallaceae bacterium]